ncbi:MAG: hypothetical protein JSU65_09430, partial [Candidatus Zixiibacteriota bacterium]
MTARCLIAAIFISFSSQVTAQEFELVNNFLMNLSFVTGTDLGMERNLDDNLSWMQDQGYTHLRFFGIFNNGVHCFPSPTLDANGYPNSSYHESVLELLVTKAAQHSIVVNFDGWEVIAESNYDTTDLGVGHVTPAELGEVVQEVLDLGVTLVTEEQFGSEYLQAIQTTTAAAGVTHETTACLWYQYSYASLIADAQLASVFNYFPRHQGEADSIIASGRGYDIPATLGVCHALLESPRYFNVPTSLAVGSFGTLQTESWRNVLRFAQIQHHPDRLSIEEQDHGFLIWGGFDFSEYIGDDLVSLSEEAIGERPIVNLVLDLGAIYSGSFTPTWYALLVSGPAIVGSFTPLGFKVVATVDSLLPEAEIYYVLLAGGTDASNVALLPDYILPLLVGTKPVIFQPTYGIPDDNDASDWLQLRAHFGLPPGETQTVFNQIPEVVSFNGHTTMWGGIELYLTPCVELLPSSQVDTTVASVILSGDVSGQETAMIIANGNSWLINSGVVHLEASYILSSLLGGPVNSPAGADIVIADGMCLIFAEYSTEVDVNLTWPGMTRVVRYDPIGDVVSDFELDLQGNFSASMTRGELVILRRLSVPCCEGIRGNVDNDAGNIIDIGDLTKLIDYLFISYTEPACMDEANVDGEGTVDIGDLTRLIDYLF